MSIWASRTLVRPKKISRLGQWPNVARPELAAAVQRLFPDVEVSINTNAQPDKRSYKVNFDLYEKLAPGHQPQVSLEAAVLDLKTGLQSMQFNDANFRESHLIRLKKIQQLIDHEVIDNNLFIK